MSVWSRENWENDKARYEQEIVDLRGRGFLDEHPLVRQARRRLASVERALTDPRLGSLVE